MPCSFIILATPLTKTKQFVSSVRCKSIFSSLHENGHNLTVLSPDVEDSKQNLTYLHLDKVYPAIYNGSEEMDFLKFTKASPIELFTFYSESSKKSCRGSLESKGFSQLMKYPDDFKFDLILHDFTMDSCLLAVMSKFGEINAVGMSAYNAPGQFGANLIYPSFVPAHDLLCTSKMTFMERIESTITHLIEHIFQEYVINKATQETVRQFYPNMPKLRSYKRNYKMYLINSDSITDNKLVISY